METTILIILAASIGYINNINRYLENLLNLRRFILLAILTVSMHSKSDF